MNQNAFQLLRQQGVTHMGLPWYEAESYEQVIAVMEDRDRLHPSYTQWLQDARKTEERARREGFMALRAVLRLPDFINHCRTHGQRVDASGRIHYANFIAAQVQREGMKN